MTDDVETIRRYVKEIRPHDNDGNPIQDDGGEPMVIAIPMKTIRIPMPDDMDDLEVDVPDTESE